MNPDSRDLIAQGKVDHREVESEGSRRQTKSEAVSKVTDTASLDWYLAFVLFCLILGVVVCTVLLLEKLHVNLAEAGEWHIVNEDYTTWLCTILDVHLTVVKDALANLCVLAGIVAALNDNKWVMADAVYTVLT